MKKDFHDQFFWYNGTKKVKRWYDANGKIANLQQLCTYIGKDVEYELLYGVLSRDVHGNSTLDILETKPNFLGINNLSANIELIDNVISDCIFDISKKMFSYYNLNQEFQVYQRNIHMKYIVSRKRN